MSFAVDFFPDFFPPPHRQIIRIAQHKHVHCIKSLRRQIHRSARWSGQLKTSTFTASNHCDARSTATPGRPISTFCASNHQISLASLAHMRFILKEKLKFSLQRRSESTAMPHHPVSFTRARSVHQITATPNPPQDHPVSSTLCVLKVGSKLKG